MSLTSGTVEANKLPQVELQKNQPAPFHGVLVPPDLFNDYQVSEFERDLTRQQLLDCETGLGELKKEPSIIQPLWFMGGFILGVLATKAARE